MNKKRKGCLPALIVFLLGVVGFSFAIQAAMDIEENKVEFDSHLSVIEGNEDQLAVIDEVLKDIGIKKINNITHDELLTGNYTYTDESGYGLEDGYRMETEDNNNILLYVSDGELLAVKYADNLLYSDGKINHHISDFFISFDEKNKYNILGQEYVNKYLNVPNSAKYPNILKWNIYKLDGQIYIESTVISQNLMGVELESAFQIIVDDEDNVTSFIFDNEKII